MMMKLQKYTTLFLLPVSMLLGQEDSTDGEVFELSPFEVSAEEDSGYYASQTLAGSRLKTNVEDVASSIQILTTDFLDDVGATNSNELFLYTTSTESAGLGGNFTDYSIPDDGTSYGDENVRVSPQLSQRVRGLGRADLTRNYFSTIIPSDRFNTERVEINRGANSILFGLGSPAGIQNTNLSMAQFNNFGEIRHMMDDQGSQRIEGDFNYEIIEDKLAVRVDLLGDYTEFYQQPAFEDDERLYAAVRWKPWNGATIRGFYEDGEREANRPALISPGYTIDFYFEGREIARQKILDMIDGITDINGNQLTIPNGFAVNGFDPFYADMPANWISKADANGDGVVDAMDDFAKVALARDAGIFPGAAQRNERLVSHPNASRHVLVGFNWDDPVANVGVFPGTNGVETNVNSRRYLPAMATKNLPYELDPGKNGRFGGYNYMSSIQPWREWDPTMVPMGIQNLEVFDFTRQLLSGDAAFQNDDWTHQNIAFEQLFLDNKMGIEVVFDTQEYSGESFVPFQGYSGIFVDLMETYKGAANPNFGRPFVQGRTQKRMDWDTRDTFRVTGFVELDPQEIFGENFVTKWVGTQTITGLYNDFDQEDRQSRHGNYMDIDPSVNQYGATLLGLADDTQLTDRNKEFNYIVYLSDQNLTQLSSPDEVRLNRMTNQQLWNGGHTATIKSFTPGGYDLYDLSTSFTEYMNDYNWSTQSIESYAAIWNGRFLNNHLIGLVGWRQDDVRANRFEAPIDPVTGVPDLGSPPIVAGARDDSVETLSWSVVAHLPDSWIPGNNRLSFHYGVSENFSLEAASQDFYGNRNPSASGETKEYGFTVSLADDKFIARVNWFETSLNNAEITKNLYSNFVNRGILNVYSHLIETEFIGPNFIWKDDDGNPILVDPATGNVNQSNPSLNTAELNLTQNYSIVAQALAAMRDPNNPAYVPPAMIQQANIVSPNGMGAAAESRENVTVADTEDIEAKGMEVELTWNPTRSWRISLNVAKQETVKANYAPRLTQLIEDFSSLLGPNGSLGSEYYFPSYTPTAGDSPQYIGGSFTPPASNSIAGRLEEQVYQEYRLEKQLEGRVSPEQRKWRVNLVTNYNFREGFLKGFGVGSALRWQDGAVIGYPAELIGYNEDGLPLFDFDIDRPHVSPSETNIDAWVRYRRKLFNGKVDWQIEFRVQNLNTDADDLIPVASTQQDEYAVAIWRSGSPRIYRLTNTFKF